MRLVTAIAALAALGTLGAARRDTVEYSLAPVFEGQALKALAVEARFIGEADGETRVRLPDEWGGETQLYRHLSPIVVDGGELTMESPGVAVVRHRKRARLTLRYQIGSGYPGEPPAGNPYRPIVRPNGFHVLGEAVFVEPEDQYQAPARFRWRDWPKTWTIASDLDHGQQRRLQVGDVLQSVSVGGSDIQVVTRPIDGGTVRLAIRGQWSFTPERFADLVASVLDAQRRFWGDMKGPYFVTLIPTEGSATQVSIGGTGRGDAFAMFATANATDDALRYVIAHEHIHTWIPRALGRMPREEEAGSYWFSEGFTDFYTYRTLLRTGVWSLEEFAKYANESISAYDASPVRSEPNSRIVKDFWKDPAVDKLPYQRGMLLAFHWDARVRAATNGAKDLDDVLFLMRSRREAARTADEVDYVRDALAKAMKDVAGLDIAQDYARYVDAGEPVALPADLFGNCARIVTESRRRFDRGWDPEATAKAGNIVTGLKPDSPAYAAGLREGMRMVRREAGVVGDSRVEYAVRVQAAAGERIIRFKPEGRESFTVREIVVAPGLDEVARKTCAARIGGA